MIVFDDILGTSNSKVLDQFFIRGRHDNLDFCYPSQCYFDVRKRTIRKNSNKISLFNQTLKDIEDLYRFVGGFDMSCDEVKEKMQKVLGKTNMVIYVLMELKRRIKEDTVFVMKAKTHIMNVLRKRSLFKDD